MNSLAISNFSEGLLKAGIVFVGLIVMVVVWFTYPWTVAPLTQWIESPMKRFFARVTNSVGMAAFSIAFGFHYVAEKKAGADKGAASEPQLQSQSSPSDNRVSEPLTPLIATPNIPAKTTVEAAEDGSSNRQKANPNPTSPASPPTRISEVTSSRPADELSKIPKEKAPDASGSQIRRDDIDLKNMKLAELRGELAALGTKIQNERDRWHASLAVINQLTNFKKTPVREGSPQYNRCMAASRVIQEVEAGATALKAEKARLEAMIQSLEAE